MSIIALSFQETQFDVIDLDNKPWLRLHQIGVALGYARSDVINKIYYRNADEFTENMTALVDLDTNGGKQQVRIFSLRGCHLLAMFARTAVAKEFRRWVLDILDRHVELSGQDDPLLTDHKYRAEARIAMNRHVEACQEIVENLGGTPAAWPEVSEQVIDGLISSMLWQSLWLLTFDPGTMRPNVRQIPTDAMPLNEKQWIKYMTEERDYVVVKKSELLSKLTT